MAIQRATRWPRTTSCSWVVTWLEINPEYPAMQPAPGIKEAQSVKRVDILLHVARVEVAEDVENADADANGANLALHFDSEVLPELRVEAGEGRQPPALVTRPHEVLLFVQQRERKPRVDVEYRRPVDAPLDLDFAPEKETVGNVLAQP